jgi:hypothetical protein
MEDSMVSLVICRERERERFALFVLLPVCPSFTLAGRLFPTNLILRS